MKWCKQMKILVADSIHPDAISLLQKSHTVVVKQVSPAELLEEISQYDGVVVRSRSKITAEIIERGKNLKVIGRAGVGVDNIAVDAATNKHIPVVYAPQGSTVSVAEITVAQMLALARNLADADKTTKAGAWEKNKYMGIELAGKILGLVGSGRIGTEVAKRCQVFGMTVQAYDPYLPAEIAKTHNITLLNNLDDLLKTSDFISIHAALTPETKHIFSLPQYKKMKPGAIIINYARGGIIKEDDLATALKEKIINGAALDVFEEEPLPKTSPLRDPTLNIIFTPHIGASTHEAQIRAGIIVANEVIKVLSGKKPDFCVNPVVLDK